MCYSSIAVIKADNSSVIASCNSGSMLSPVRFKTAPPGKNCAPCGLPLKKIAKSTKTSIIYIHQGCGKLRKPAVIYTQVDIMLPHEIIGLRQGARRQL